MFPVIRKACRTLAVLVVCLPVAAQDTKVVPTPTPAASLSSPSNSDPSKEAVILERSLTKISYEADGTGIKEVSNALRMQSQAGVQAFAILTFPYTSYNDTVDVDYVRVKKPDGTIIATPAYNVQDMPADVTRGAPMYSDLHEKHVTVKALGVGDVLEFLVRYRTIKPEIPGQFWYQQTFTKAFITRDEELEISLPKDKYVKISSPDLQPVIKDEAGRRIYTWKTSNSDLKGRDTLLKKSEAPKPSVELTTFHSWEEVGRWYADLQRSQVVVTPQIQAKSAELTSGLTTDDAKLRAIYDYVSTQFHYVSLSFGIGRYQPHAAEDVFENQYADCKDKHTLLAAMLKAAGFEAWPVLINSSRKLDAEIPSPGQFDHVISAVPSGNNIIWLDTTPAVSPFGLLLLPLRGKQALVIAAGQPATLMMTPSEPPFPSLRRFEADGALTSDGMLTMHVEQTIRGDVEVLYRAAFRNVSPAQWKDLGQQISSASGFGGEVSNVTASEPDKTEKPFQFSYDYTRKNYSNWGDHQISDPLPWFGIEGASTEEEKPAEPVKLGALGEVIFQSKIKLPAGYIPKFSDEKGISQDFANYRANYAVENGVLLSTRRLTIKKSEVPLDSWDDYKKFAKFLSDERDRYLDLVTGAIVYPAGEGPNSGAKPNIAVAGTNPAAMKLMQEGSTALRDRDLSRAEEAFKRVIEMDEKFPGAHASLGWVYFTRNDHEGGIRELRKEEEYNPENLSTYQVLGQVLRALKRNEEAMEQYRELLKRDPGSRDGTLAMADMLSKGKKYSEAVAILEKALEKAPDSSALKYAMGNAYLQNKQYDKGLSTFKEALPANPTAGMLNDVAYSLADESVGLDFAEECGQKALRQLEANSLKAEDDEAALANTRLLSYTWDTVGWIYFRQGQYDKALPYLKAAWLISQDGTPGDHLAQLYEKQNRKQDAAHQYLLALAASNKEEIRLHYKKLTGEEADVTPKLNRQSSTGRGYTFPGDELSRMRMIQLSTNPHAAGSAVLTVIFSPSKIENVKFVSGVESLKSMSDQFSFAKMAIQIPDTDPTRIVRRGILMCGTTGCGFTFLLPDTLSAVGSVPPSD